MRFLAVFLPVAAASPFGKACRAPCASDLSRKSVSYQGAYLDEVEAFLGIRYAQDTSGANRFKPPVPFTPPSKSFVDATTGGPACPQPTDSIPPGPFGLYASPVNGISEDCLRLNVWRPNGTKADDELPVLVFLHGGSLLQGNKDAELYRPGGLILQSKAIGYPIIHVELNYRLGTVFGFAQSKALENDQSENAGIRDQRLALEWVQQNIASFGGDPKKVTIHGQSSGGLSVGMQILAYGGKKPVPFQQAICESEVLDLAITSNVTRVAMEATVSNTTCSGSSIDSPATIRCLRGLSTQALLDAQNSYAPPPPTGNNGDFWLPVVDGDILPDAPSTLVQRRRFAKGIQTIIGWTEDELKFLVDTSLNTSQDTYDYIHAYIPDVSETNLKKLLSLYPSSDFRPLYFPNGTFEFSREVNRAGRIVRDLVFVCQPLLFGEAFDDVGDTVYLYEQNQTLLTPALEGFGLYDFGVPHLSELIYVFGNISKYNVSGYDFQPKASDYRLEKQESGSWAAFTATGDPSLPGPGTLDRWLPADFQDQTFGVFVIGGPSEGYSGPRGSAAARNAVALQKLRERCEFLNSQEIVKQLRY